MTTRRFLTWLLLLLLITGGAVLATQFLQVRHHIDHNHYKLIQPGMTEAQVEAILGVPAGDYDGYESCGFAFFWMSTGDQKLNRKTWASRECCILITFDAAQPGNRVLQADFCSSYPVTWWAKRSRRAEGDPALPFLKKK